MPIAVDISNYGGELNVRTVTDWRDAGIRKVIVGVHDVALAHRQMDAVTRGGLKLEAYSQMYFRANSIALRDNYLRAIEGMPVERTWLAFEDKNAPKDQDSVIPWIRGCLAVFERYPPPEGIGIYTAPWWWGPWTGDTGLFNHYPLWVAQYDNEANLSFTPFGGWTTCVMKQYTNTIGLLGYSVDMDYYEEDNVSTAEILAQLDKIENLMKGKEFQRRIALMILTEDEKLGDQAYMELKYVRGLAGKPT
jgi:GH25 family lysozyme M1 (1,4-beta-N-acetylmuramidase)